MAINRENLKRMIDSMSEEQASEVFYFMNQLKDKDLNELRLAEDEELINQIEKSRENRKNGKVYNKEKGLSYLRENIEGSENG